MQQNFISWLEKNKPKSSRHYSSGFNTIEGILKENNLSSLNNWTYQNYSAEYDRLVSIETFQTLNNTGNNILTATLSNYKKFMEEYTETPELPFETFGWRWATTGIASHLNKPQSLKIVIDALLINGNGKDNYTQDFKKLIEKLSVNKYSISKNESDKLSKLSNPKIEKNIIENSANYWYHLGLLDTTGRNAKISDLGERFLNGFISNDEFILDRIDNYSLPNNAYENEEINKWDNSNVKIHPIKLIQDILAHLHLNYETSQQYITENDLVYIVIPCSYDLVKFNIEYISHHIIEYRKNPSYYSSWPKPQSIYSEDKGLRMANEFLYFLEVFGFLSSNKEGNIRSNDKKYYSTQKFIKIEVDDNDNKTISVPIIQKGFNLSTFQADCELAGLIYSNQIITRFVSSLATKPFVVLSGLSGSGKTKLAQAFVQWISQDKSQYCIVPVGADWTNREPLLGYVNALEDKEYILPENGALQLMIEANKKENTSKPYFLILDEMNLSHVERYFADFLSIMESGDNIKLHSSKKNLNSYKDVEFKNSIEVSRELTWPKNLFVIGTVNIDETTYMFSPKVLDRANVIEFRIRPEELKTYFEKGKHLDMNKLWVENSKVGKGAKFMEDFASIAEKDVKKENLDILNPELEKFFAELQEVGTEFGYRTASEIQTLFSKIDIINPEFYLDEKIKENYKKKDNFKIDVAIMQKLLPKLHGSRSKLIDPLKILAILCYKQDKDFKFSDKEKKDIFDKSSDFKSRVIYPISLEKITRMYRNVLDNGFTSYAEA